MAKVYENIPPKIQEWISTQKIFFVATAPLTADGLINLSPKGLDSFRVLDDNTIAYLDLTGSGVETIAHIKENQRLTIMMCAFEGAPRILRLYGKAKVHQKGTEAFEQLKDQFPHYINSRSIIVSHVFKVITSCGYAVPLMDYQSDRDVLDKSAAKKGTDGIDQYQREKNLESLDGLTALEF